MGTPMWQRIAVWMLRLCVGAVFIVSGFVKMVDLWGFVFKIEEYLAVWQLVQPRTIVFMVAMLVSGYEFVLGTLLAMGCYKRVAPWGLMLAMAVMLPLTAYLWVADPVSDCGCFGDFWKMSNAATFWKNVAITVALGVLLKWNAGLKESLFNPAIQWMVGAWISLYAIIVGLYGYNAQPMLDFRAFPVGAPLVAEANEEDDNFTLLYEKDGVRKEFPLEALPDSTWIFVDRVPLSGGDNYEEKGGDFAMFDEDGNDVTSEVVDGEGMQLLLVVPEPRRAGVTFSYVVNEVYEYADSIGIPFAALLGTDADGVLRWKDNAMADYPCYSVDDTQLKELSRGNVSLVILNDGKVESKTTLSSMNSDVIESPESSDAFILELTGHGKRWFTAINVIFGGALLLLYLFQGIILAIRAKIRRRYRRKEAKNS